MDTDGRGAIELFTKLARTNGLASSVEAFRSLEKFDEDEIVNLCQQYQELISSAEQGFPPKIFAGAHDAWYPGPSDTEGHWPLLKQQLIAVNGQDRVEALDAASTKIVAYTSDVSKEQWQCRGLVIGNVQSGKTENFTAVIAKAVDAGYNLVIVLSGIHNGLRSQTQKRLVRDLCSLNLEGWYELTTAEHDFNTPPIKAEALFVGRNRPTVICVVKKNAAVLRKLKNWLERANRNGSLRDVRALVIDDEADQASVETPKINPLIRKINGVFSRCTYIGYTATPYANVLIDPNADDLYPRDFVLALPTSDRYFGSEKIFGRDDLSDPTDGDPVDGYDMVRKVENEEAAALRPPKEGTFEPSVEGSLRKAIRWFLLATAARRARGDSDHSTMLIHTSMKTSVHQAFKQPIKRFLKSEEAGLDERRPESEAAYEMLWRDETQRVPAEGFPDLKIVTPSYEVVRAHLVAVASETQVILDNSKSEDRLNYDGDPVTAIAVGGNTLSRGLTLEGLTVSYFVRSAKAYDTLMQMGRWFGYRIGYEDLPRIYMTDELKRWFRHMSSVEHEIRQEADFYDAQNLTPRDYGMRIRTHPSLLVTTKLGAARLTSTSYGGRRVQVRYFERTDKAWLDGNVAAADNLIRAIEHHGIAPEPAVSGGPVLWASVPMKFIVDFLKGYTVHEDSPELHRQLLLSYIESEVENGSLVEWNVAVMADGTTANGTVDLGASSYGRIVRSRLNDGDTARADIKTLMSKEHRVIDHLELAQSTARRLSEHDLMERRNADPVLSRRGLLLLYPIDPLSPPAKNLPEEAKSLRVELGAVSDVIGLGLVFPGNADHSVRNTFISVAPDVLELEEPEDEDPDVGDSAETGAAGQP